MPQEGNYGLHKLCTFPLDGYVSEMTVFIKKILKAPHPFQVYMYVRVITHIWIPWVGCFDGILQGSAPF
jgi:hypothetical protein